MPSALGCLVFRKEVLWALGIQRDETILHGGLYWLFLKKNWENI